jgi:ribose 5-phosphate isomerase B
VALVGRRLRRFQMKIIIGSDHLGFPLKEDLKTYLADLDHEVIDLGVGSATEEVDYPDVGRALAERIAGGEADRGILVCGTGIGMAIAANKVPGVRAAVCHDPYSAERSRKSNNAQVLAMGSQIVAPTVARVLIDHWLESEFGGGRSTRKVDKLEQIDRDYRTDG